MAEKKYTKAEGEKAIAEERAAHRQRAADRKAARARGEVNQTHDPKTYKDGKAPWEKRGTGKWGDHKNMFGK